MAKKLVLESENDLVGHKRMIYVFDGADKTKELTRKVIVEFFKKSLGFTDDEIIFVNLYDISTSGSFDCDHLELEFSYETREAMYNSARLIFEDTQHGLAKQVLNIAICEGWNTHASVYFKGYSDFELTIELTDAFNLPNAQEYFASLA